MTARVAAITLTVENLSSGLWHWQIFVAKLPMLVVLAVVLPFLPFLPFLITLPALVAPVLTLTAAAVAAATAAAAITTDIGHAAAAAAGGTGLSPVVVGVVLVASLVACRSLVAFGHWAGAAARGLVAVVAGATICWLLLALALIATCIAACIVAGLAGTVAVGGLFVGLGCLARAVLLAFFVALQGEEMQHGFERGHATLL